MFDQNLIRQKGHTTALTSPNTKLVVIGPNLVKLSKSWLSHSIQTCDLGIYIKPISSYLLTHRNSVAITFLKIILFVYGFLTATTFPVRFSIFYGLILLYSIQSFLSIKLKGCSFIFCIPNTKE